MWSARDWLTIGLFFVGVMLSAVAFLLKRFLNRVDKHDGALYGKEGLFQLLTQYVKREDHDVANAELAAHMEKMRLEGIQREGRIIEAIEQREGRLLEAIEREGSRSASENRILRSDFSKLHDRIDRIRDGTRRQ